ncbi:reticulon-1 isoform X2 [Protopterus annectens]|uniref:reticulon-1 isoform X2 n=1 Tax=Protopterus annectens TaxID=7888 RepID=UPI001CFC114F|nr:reticulon-1 isoform X2 [Protopterus annectens]
MSSLGTKWSEEDFEPMECIRSSASQAKGAAVELGDADNAGLRESNKDKAHQLQLQEAESNEQLKNLPVSLTTASTDVPYCGITKDPDISTALEDNKDLGNITASQASKVSGEGAIYTSLIPDYHSISQEDSVYGTENLHKECSTVSGSSSTEELNTTPGLVHSLSSLESHVMFSSDSGIEMTPGESFDVHKTLTEEVKTDAYRYMDISPSEEATSQGESEMKWKSKDDFLKSMNSDASTNVQQIHKTDKKSSEDLVMSKEINSELAHRQEPQKDIKWEQHPVLEIAYNSPAVTITCTEMETVIEPDVQITSSYGRETGLRPGPDVVPTVTVSEPEDDSPESLTPPFSGTEESDSQTESVHHISEDELMSAFKSKESRQPCPSDIAGEHNKPSHSEEKPDEAIKNEKERSNASSHLDYEASSGESGDSEIELVSEDPLAADGAMHSSYMSFSHAGGPPPSPASPSIQYSILREEREAELDSDLIIESCDASSASEESPKRDQDSPGVKPVTMDIIQEEADASPVYKETAQHYRSGPAESLISMTKADNQEPVTCVKTSTKFVTPLVRVEEPSPEDYSEESCKSENRSFEEIAPNQRQAVVKDVGNYKSMMAFPSLLNKDKAIDLLYWRDIKQTGICFGSLLLLLFSLTQFSVVSVVAYLALAALSATISFRIYKSVLQAVQKTDDGHPFKSYLDMEIALSSEQIQKYTDCLHAYVNNTVKELRRLFLVQDLVDSLKFAVLMWLLTYVGHLFNGLTLLIMAVISMFTLPVLYDKYQAQIDQYLGLVRTHINSVIAKIQAKIPGAKRKAE